MKKPKKIVLGITGGFGSGKTTVAGIFKSFGAKIIDADKIAHSQLSPKTKTYKKIVKTFGERVLEANGAINRNKLAQVVFASKTSLKKINRIVHPQVIRIIRKKIKKIAKGIVALDAPLLLEAGLKNMIDKLIVVNISQKKQIERVHRKTGLRQRQILGRIKSQLSLEAKVSLADFVIDNSGTITQTKKQVLEIRRLLSNEGRTYGAKRT